RAQPASRLPSREIDETRRDAAAPALPRYLRLRKRQPVSSGWLNHTTRSSERTRTSRKTSLHIAMLFCHTTKSLYEREPISENCKPKTENFAKSFCNQTAPALVSRNSSAPH